MCNGSHCMLQFGQPWPTLFEILTFLGHGLPYSNNKSVKRLDNQWLKYEIMVCTISEKQIILSWFLNEGAIFV